MRHTSSPAKMNRERKKILLSVVALGCLLWLVACSRYVMIAGKLSCEIISWSRTIEFVILSVGVGVMSISIAYYTTAFVYEEREELRNWRQAKSLIIAGLIAFGVAAIPFYLAIFARNNLFTYYWGECLEIGG